MKRLPRVLLIPAILIGTSSVLVLGYEAIAAPISLGLKGVARNYGKILKDIPIAQAPKNAPNRPKNLKGLPKKPAPTYKGGPQTTETTFILNIDNRTDKFIHTFVNGEYRGTIEPWGDGTYHATSGTANVFCRGVDGNSFWATAIARDSGNRYFLNR